MAALDSEVREPSLPDDAEPSTAGELSMHSNEEEKEQCVGNNGVWKPMQ